MTHRLVYIYLLLIFLFSAPMAAHTSSEWLMKGIESENKENFALAMRYFTRGLEEAVREGDSLTVMRCTGYIGNVYYNLYDYTRATSYMLKGYTMAVNYNNKILQSKFLANLVGVYCKTRNIEKAKYYFKLYEALPVEADYDDYYYYVLYNKARIANVEGKLKEALIFHQQALDWAINKHLTTDRQLFQLCEIGEIQLSEGHYDLAIDYGSRCIEPAKEAGELDLLTSVYKMIADAYELKGDTTLEREYRRRYLELSDSIFNRMKISIADHDLVEYEERQATEHLDSLHGVISRQAIIIVAISVVGVILVVFSLILYRYNRKLRMVHRKLIEKNTELQKIESARQTMMLQMLDQSPATEEMTKNSIGLDKKQANELLQRIVKVMDDIKTIANPDFSLNVLADLVESNTRYVSWVINDTYGKNFKTLLNEYRIREACKRLSDPQFSSSVTIQAIYEELGYTNAVSFIRAFKKVNGMTPSEYQRAMKTPEEE